MLFICDQDNICDGVADMIWYDQDNISHFSVPLDSHIIYMQIELLNYYSFQW
jgi:hypothetical protein